MFNTVVSGTEATNEKLKENNGEELSNIIHKYWGDTIDKEFKRNSNLMFIIEPIFIVSYATGEEKTDTDEFDKAKELIDQLEDSVDIFKVGLEQYVAKVCLFHSR